MEADPDTEYWHRPFYPFRESQVLLSSDYLMGVFRRMVGHPYDSGHKIEDLYQFEYYEGYTVPESVYTKHLTILPASLRCAPKMQSKDKPPDHLITVNYNKQKNSIFNQIKRYITYMERLFPLIISEYDENARPIIVDAGDIDTTSTIDNDNVIINKNKDVQFLAKKNYNNSCIHNGLINPYYVNRYYHSKEEEEKEEEDNEDDENDNNNNNNNNNDYYYAIKNDPIADELFSTEFMFELNTSEWNIFTCSSISKGKSAADIIDSQIDIEHAGFIIYGSARFYMDYIFKNELSEKFAEMKNSLITNSVQKSELESKIQEYKHYAKNKIAKINEDNNNNNEEKMETDEDCDNIPFKYSDEFNPLLSNLKYILDQRAKAIEERLHLSEFVDKDKKKKKLNKNAKKLKRKFLKENDDDDNNTVISTSKQYQQKQQQQYNANNQKRQKTKTPGDKNLINQFNGKKGKWQENQYKRIKETARAGAACDPTLAFYEIGLGRGLMRHQYKNIKINTKNLEECKKFIRHCNIERNKLLALKKKIYERQLQWNEIQKQKIQEKLETGYTNFNKVTFTNENIDTLFPIVLSESEKEDLQAGDIYPAAFYIFKQGKDEESIVLNRMFNLGMFTPENYGVDKLKIGDVLRINRKDGDVVLINRQPTLHKYGMAAFIVRERPGHLIYINPIEFSKMNGD